MKLFSWPSSVFESEGRTDQRQRTRRVEAVPGGAPWVAGRD